MLNPFLESSTANPIPLASRRRLESTTHTLGAGKGLASCFAQIEMTNDAKSMEPRGRSPAKRATAKNISSSIAGQIFWQFREKNLFTAPGGACPAAQPPPGEAQKQLEFIGDFSGVEFSTR